MCVCVCVSYKVNFKHNAISSSLLSDGLKFSLHICKYLKVFLFTL